MALQEAKKLDFFSTPHQEAIQELLEGPQLDEMGNKAISVFRLVTSARIGRLQNIKQRISRLSERALHNLLGLEDDKLKMLEPHLDSVRKGFIVDYRDLPLEAIEKITVEKLISADPEHLKAFKRVLARDEDGELKNNPGYTTLFELPTSALKDFGKAIFQNPNLLTDLKFYAGESMLIWTKHLDIPNGTVAELLGHRSEEVRAFYRVPENLRLTLKLVHDELRLAHLLGIPLDKVQTLGLANLVCLSADQLQALRSFPIEIVELIGLERYCSLDANARYAVGKVDVETVRILGIDTLEELVSRTPDRSEVLKKKCTEIGPYYIYMRDSREVSGKDPDRIDKLRISPENCLKVLNLLSKEKLEKLAGEERESLLDSTVSDFEDMLEEELESKYGYSRNEAKKMRRHIHSIEEDKAFILDAWGQGLDPEKTSYCSQALSCPDYFFLKKTLQLKSIKIGLIVQVVQEIKNSASSREALESLFHKKGSALNEQELFDFLEGKRKELIEELGPWEDVSDNPTETLTADKIRRWGSRRADYPKQTAAWRQAVAKLEYQGLLLYPPTNHLLYVDPEVITALDKHIEPELILRIGIPNLREMTHADIVRVLAQKEGLLASHLYMAEPEDAKA